MNKEFAILTTGNLKIRHFDTRDETLNVVKTLLSGNIPFIIFHYQVSSRGYVQMKHL